MPTVQVGDLSMYYVEAGAGEPVLPIMGFGGDHTAWAFQMGAFSVRHRDMRIGLGRERTLRTLRVIHAAGHGYFLEQPDAFNALALDFIARSSS